MENLHGIIPWMQHLVQMIPPSGVVLVGAGDGSDEWMSFLSELSDVTCLIVEADSVKFKLLESISSSKPNWNVYNEVVSKDSREIDFYQTTLSSENSLIAPDQLRHIWPNLKVQHVQQSQSIPIDRLLNGTVSNINWLLVNCLPALPIIEGMVENLDVMDVICSRVILSNTDTGPESAILKALQDFLERKGFSLQTVEASRHPSLGHALFIRTDRIDKNDLRQHLAQSEEPYESLLKKLADAEAKLEIQMTLRYQLAILTDENTKLKCLTAENSARIESLEKTNADLMGTPKMIEQKVLIEKNQIHEPSLRYYQKIAKKYKKTEPPPFLFIDSKSLPRSGIHYLKSAFSQLLGDQFSFCEWYNEVGCCKQHPCSLLCYAEHACKNNSFRLRLKKSHDFKHTDPKVPTSSVLQRLVLIRDPLFILTSWFELDQLTKYRTNLLESGIDIRKIWLMHEKELQFAAYKILSSVFEPPSVDECKIWLGAKARYIIEFTNNWVLPMVGNPDPYTKVVSYDKLDEYVINTIKPYRSILSKDSITSLDAFADRTNEKFISRTDPYSLHVKCIETYVRKMADIFEETALHISNHECAATYASSIKCKSVL